jgi:hypothetical protein
LAESWLVESDIVLLFENKGPEMAESIAIGVTTQLEDRWKGVKHS